MQNSPLIDALRDDLAALQDAGVIAVEVLTAFDATLRQGVPADSRIADTRIDAIPQGRKIRDSVSEI